MGFQLTSENYYSDIANYEYMSVSQFKDFAGTYGKLGCEECAMAIGYVFYAAVGGFILATLIGMTAVRGICSSVWLFTFQFTLLPAAIVIVLYFIIAVIASEAGIYFWEKGSITERLRNL